MTVSAVWLNSNHAQAFRTDLKQSIIKELISIKSPAPEEKVDVIYVLGGNQASLGFKAKTVSGFFQKGICKRIWVSSLSGITEYNQVLGRNWTKNEYTLMKLKKFGIPNKYVELIKIKEGFFGTFSEAEKISSLLEEKGYKSILLVAQPYHTQRVNLSFNKYLADQNVSMYIQGSGERMWMRHLIVEYIKLKVYKYFLI